MEDVGSSPLGEGPLRVGERVVVRYRLRPEIADDGDGDSPPAHRPTMSDAVGVLTEVTPEIVVVTTRRGAVSIERSCVLLAKRVPPAPSPRNRTRPIDPPLPLR